MSDLDQLVERALRERDDDALARADAEPGWFAQAVALFTGRLAWVHWTIMIGQLVMFAVGAWCAVNFFQASDVMSALRWGLPGVVLLCYAAIFKSALGPQMETNRLLMEIKRLELRVERLRTERAATGEE